MEKQLIDFIQNPKNIELLNLGQIDTLLQKCPVNLRPQLIKMLADSDDLQDVFKSVEPKVTNFLNQHKINSNDLILKIVNNSIRLELNNTQVLNDLANQLNNEFGVDLQQGYPEIFS